MTNFTLRSGRDEGWIHSELDAVTVALRVHDPRMEVNMSTEPITVGRESNDRKLDAGTWGVFFVWIGIAFLAHVPWGVWLLGVGAIIYGAQLVRKLVGLPLDALWLVAGTLFILGGVSDITPFGLDIAIIPLLCIAGGVLLLARAFRGPRPHQA